MLKKLFSGYLAVAMLAMMLPFGSGVLAMADISSMRVHDVGGITPEYFVEGEQINISGRCMGVSDGEIVTGYVMPGGVDELTPYSGHLSTFTLSTEYYSDLQIMSSATKGEYRVAIDVDGSGTATAGDCYSSAELFKVQENGLYIANPQGKRTESYFTGDDIYIMGACYPGKEYEIRLTSDEDWVDGSAHMSSYTAFGTLTTDNTGAFPLTKAFVGLATAAGYDIILDQTGMGEGHEHVYHPEEDCLLGENVAGFYMYNAGATVAASLNGFNPEDTVLEYADGEVRQMVMSFDLKVGPEGVARFNGLTLKAKNIANDANLAKVSLVKDINANGTQDVGEVDFAWGTYDVDNGTVELSANDGSSESLDPNGVYPFLVFYTFEMDDFEDADKLEFDLASLDMEAIDMDGWMPLQIKELPLESSVLTLTVPVEEEGGEGEGSGDVVPDEDGIASPFTDIAGHEYETYIEDLRLKGVVNGKSEGFFAPDDLLNRAEITKMASLAFDYVVPASVDEKPFPDVETSQWYAVYLYVAKTAGIVAGYPDGTFQPANNVNRVESLKIVIESSKLDYSGAEVASFPDTIEDWYSSYLNYAIKYDLADPYSVGADSGMFKPAQFATRGEAAKMISQMMTRVAAAE